MQGNQEASLVPELLKQETPPGSEISGGWFPPGSKAASQAHSERLKMASEPERATEGRVGMRTGDHFSTHIAGGASKQVKKLFLFPRRREEAAE